MTYKQKKAKMSPHLSHPVPGLHVVRLHFKGFLANPDAGPHEACKAQLLFGEVLDFEQAERGVG